MAQLIPWMSLRYLEKSWLSGIKPFNVILKSVTLSASYVILPKSYVQNVSLHVLHIPLTINVKLILVAIPTFNRVEHYLNEIKRANYTNRNSAKGILHLCAFSRWLWEYINFKSSWSIFVSNVPLHHCKKREEDAGRTGALDGFLLLFLI